MPMETVSLALAATALVAAGVGFLLGRRTGAVGQRLREVEARLEQTEKERELAQASVEAAKAEIQRVTSELEGYRGRVVEHFTGTSGLLRDLTLQYRAVYDHLTAGATSLCPEGSVDLLEGLRPVQISEGPGDDGSPAPEANAAEEAPAEDAAPRP